jgi:hypothetical protein
MLEDSQKRPLAGESSSGNPANIQLENVRLLWLDGGAGSIPSRFLIVEDTDTGDVLLPLYVVWFDKRFGDERLRTERYGGQAVLRSTTKRPLARPQWSPPLPPSKEAIATIPSVRKPTHLRRLEMSWQHIHALHPRDELFAQARHPQVSRGEYPRGQRAQKQAGAVALALGV